MQLCLQTAPNSQLCLQWNITIRARQRKGALAEGCKYEEKNVVALGLLPKQINLDCCCTFAVLRSPECCFWLEKKEDLCCGPRHRLWPFQAGVHTKGQQSQDWTCSVAPFHVQSPTLSPTGGPDCCSPVLHISSSAADLCRLFISHTLFPSACVLWGALCIEVGVEKARGNRKLISNWVMVNSISLPGAKRQEISHTLRRSHSSGNPYGSLFLWSRKTSLSQ